MNRRRIIGLCGYAQVGKDTAATHLAEHYGYTRWAFADYLKADLADLVYKHLALNIWTVQGETKEKLRPLLVAWGAVARAFEPGFWVRRLFAELPVTGKFVISDVRYLNEARAIQAAGGIVIYIARPGYGPANEEEARSIEEIWNAPGPPPFWGAVKNNGTREELGRAVFRVVSAAEEAGEFEQAQHVTREAG